MSTESKTPREQEEDRMNRIMCQWKALPREENEALWLKLWEEAFILAFRLFDKKRNGEFNEDLHDLLVDLMEKYDPEKGAFVHYFNYVRAKRSKPSKSELLRAKRTRYLEEPVGGEDSKITLGETLPDQSLEEDELILRADAEQALLELSALILNFSQNHHGKNCNETRRMWYRLFFTEDITDGMKEAYATIFHERDIFAAMNTDYLDYYMSKSCRTLKEITFTPLRPYCQVVPEREDGRETPVPIPADVSLAFLRLRAGLKVGASARSNQIKAYREEKEQLHIC